MICTAPNDPARREEALKTALEVIKAQPGLLGAMINGTKTANFITEMADAFLVYVTGKPSQPAK